MVEFEKKRGGEGTVPTGPTLYPQLYILAKDWIELDKNSEPIKFPVADRNL